MTGKPLAEWSLGNRIALTVVIVLVILLGFALFGYLTGRWDDAQAQQEPRLYQGIPLDTHLLELDKVALEEAYHQHLIRLWNVWLTDGAKESQRIKTGLRIARQAYHIAAQEIEKREQEIEQRK